MSEGQQGFFLSKNSAGIRTWNFPEAWGGEFAHWVASLWHARWLCVTFGGFPALKATIIEPFFSAKLFIPYQLAAFRPVWLYSGFCALKAKFSSQFLLISY
jgi:hypothetical protein